MRAPRRRFGLPPGTHVESLDREELVIESIRRAPEDWMSLSWQPDYETVRRIGWHMAARTGTDFRIGRRLLQLLSPDGYLLPPPEFRLARVTEPTDDEMFQAPFVTPFRIELWQSGSTPAEWRVNGSVYHPQWEPRLWSRLLYLNRERRMALTDEGWVRLGRRI